LYKGKQEPKQRNNNESGDRQRSEIEDVTGATAGKKGMQLQKTREGLEKREDRPYGSFDDRDTLIRDLGLRESVKRKNPYAALRLEETCKLTCKCLSAPPHRIKGRGGGCAKTGALAQSPEGCLGAGTSGKKRAFRTSAPGCPQSG